MKKPVAPKVRLLVLALMVSGLVVAQQIPPGPPAPPPPANAIPAPGELGGPLPGLTSAQREAFDAGRIEFENVETPASGLGPIFNNVSCVACHSRPAIGGASGITVTRFGRSENGVFDALESKGGSLLQQFAINPAVRETIPPEANVIARRITTPLFGAGLIEAIPDQAIRQNAAAQKPDGITGRVAVIKDPASGDMRVGRFGWKAQHATLLSFAGDAYNNEMGITNRLFPTENAPNGNVELLKRFDRLADPEDTVDPNTGRSDIDASADFMRLLAAPVPAALTPSAAAGQTLFTQAGCAACHTPSYQSGRSPIAALDRKTVNLFSDLLLHDMGSLGDGIGQADAGTSEMRTAPLWGLRFRRQLLHDGRAGNTDTAIREHDGEAAIARNRYLGLSALEKRQLLDYLNSL
ncbi:MAG: hypothetical protein HY255_13120 [Betaproteobacteria bacterium]|nr:hypothetical protein [Betaproteobacteria bacterium]